VLEYSTSRAERLIATGRVMLAASTLLAIWVDPTGPLKDPRTGAAVLTVYVVYAAILAGVTWLADPPPGRFRLAAHAIDLAVFTVVMYLTEGPTSPFLALFVFAIVAGTVRWGGRGTVWTALAAMALFLALGFHASQFKHDPYFDLNQPRSSEPPSRLDLQVVHEKMEPRSRSRHAVELLLYASSGRPLVACRCFARKYVEISREDGA
jgi:hypothetical protein